ncbi:MAG: hypothetical protein OHK0046_36630 [Anaerolineae bacterium]
MTNLTLSQMWAIVSIMAAVAFIGTAMFLDGDVQTFAFVVISMLVAGFAVVTSNNKEKRGE